MSAVASRPVRVLIVDDEPDIELLIRQRFKRRPNDFDFAFARNGEDALATLERDPSIDVVVTDINMPRMDGLTLLSKLNGNGDMRKAVILSAYGDMQNIRTAMNRGAFDFLTKPIDFHDFEITIRKTFEALEADRQGLEARRQLVALQKELDIAARIQQSILPREFFPERTDFQLYAEMLPARAIGGDFYDFLLIDEGKLGFVIGDVSGKGIPAALFMAVSRTLLRATALQGTEPADCLQYMNDVLRGQAQDAVYVTVFYGILDTATGELKYVIGGHNPPYLVSLAGEVRAIDEPAGMVVGLLAEATYQTGVTRLAPGELIFLFTDGVTEALNEEQKFFGERRLRSALAAQAGNAPTAVIRAVLGEVTAFSGGTAQTDDITVLAVRYGRDGEAPQK